MARSRRPPSREALARARRRPAAERRELNALVRAARERRLYAEREAARIQRDLSRAFAREADRLYAEANRFTVAYGRRLRRALARGAPSKAAARGHREPGEHRRRKEKAEAEGRLTETDQRFLKRQVAGLGPEREADARQAFLEMTRAERDDAKAHQRERARAARRGVKLPNPDGWSKASPLYLTRFSPRRRAIPAWAA